MVVSIRSSNFAAYVALLIRWERQEFELAKLMREGGLHYGVLSNMATEIENLTTIL